MARSIKELLWKYPSVIITENELTSLLKGSSDSRYSRLKRAVQQGDLIRIKRGLYCLGKSLQLHPIHPFDLSQKIYGPSYVSLESALSYHNLIPEQVHTITCVTIKRANEFKTPVGNFSYSRLPIENFFLGVQHIKENNYQFFMATPWKALLDYIYCYKKNWVDLQPVQESLRIELDELPSLNITVLQNLEKYYHSQRITKFMNNIPKEFIREH